jgi:P-type E1-E2 ATPase
MIYKVPEIGEMELKTIVLDLNGTLAVKGKIVSGVKNRLRELKKMGYSMVFFSGDQRGNAQELADTLGIEFRKALNSAEKEKHLLQMESDKTVAIGNARIDIGMFKHAKVSIATVQAEGIHSGILNYVDIIVPCITDALDILIDENTFSATMRT